MSEQNLKRSKNDERRKHIDIKTGLPKRRVVEDIKTNEARQMIIEYKYNKKEYPECE